MEKDIYGIIYMIKNIVNNKVYIGLTVSGRGFNGRYSANGEGIERVYNFYKYQEKNNQYVNIHLLNSIEKYGFENFVVDEKKDFAYSKQELMDKEKYWISYYKSNDFKYGYNRTEGGESFLRGEDHPRWNRVEFSCDICGKLGYKLKSKHDINKYNYCSKDCSDKGQSLFYCGENHKDYNRYNIVCTYCGREALKPISLIEGRKLNYCSRECKDNHQKITMFGTNNPNYGNGHKIAGSKNGRARKVVCLTTGEVFECLKDAATKYKTKNNYISACCNGRQKTSGVLCDGTKLEWAYYENVIS